MDRRSDEQLLAAALEAAVPVEPNLEDAHVWLGGARGGRVRYVP